MKDIDMILPSVMPQVPGCAEPTAIAAIRQAAIEFCEATRAWRARDQFEVTKSSCSIVCAPASAVIFEFESVFFNGRRLEQVSVLELDRDHPNWADDSREPSGTARYFTQTEHDTIRVVPAATGKVDISLYVRPSEDALQLPDFLVDRYRNVLANGALSRLLLVPGQPFFSPDMAGYYATRFQQSLDRNFNVNIRGQQRARTRTKPHYF